MKWNFRTSSAIAQTISVKKEYLFERRYTSQQGRVSVTLMRYINDRPSEEDCRLYRRGEALIFCAVTYLINEIMPWNG
jgi:hypothetical protein